MRQFAVLLGLLCLTPTLQADVLKRIPTEATLAVVLEKPRQFLETVIQHDITKQAYQLPQLKEVLQSTNVKRFFQLLEYYERESGKSWPELVDALAGKGLVLAVKTTTDPAPVLLVAEGRDAEVSHQVFEMAIKLLESEIARNAGESPEAPKLVREKYLGYDTLHLGDDLHAAHIGTTLYVSNKKAALHASLKLLQSKEGSSSLGTKAEVQQARQLLGGDPIGWLWFDFAKVQDQQSTKDFFAATRKDLLQTLVLGSSIDAFRRTNILAAGLYLEGRDARLKLRLPVKRAELPKELAVHVPEQGQPGSLPFLEPKNVLYSQSFHLDLAAMWKHRKGLFNDEVLPQLEQAERDVSRILPGVKISKILEQSGPHHRFVAVSTDYQTYKVKPVQPLPPFALVSTFRDEQFAKSATTAIRAGGLVGSLQFGLKMTEVEHQGIKVVSYKFAENKPLEGDLENFRFNFAPSFAVLGDNLIVASQPGLVQDLIDELKKPQSNKPAASVWRAKGYANAAAQFQRMLPDSLLSNLVLSQGISLPEARKQLDQLSRFIEQLGTARVTIDHADKWFEIEAHWQPK